MVMSPCNPLLCSISPLVFKSDLSCRYEAPSTGVIVLKFFFTIMAWGKLLKGVSGICIFILNKYMVRNELID